MNDYDYIIDAFSRDGNNTNLEVDNLTVGCISSKNNNFSLDSNGNLTVNSITTSGGGIDFDRIYPVGAIYLSVVNTNPGTLFGGTWEQIEDKFLLSAGTTYQAGTIGGEASHTLVENELPNITGQVTFHGDGTEGAVVSNVSGHFSTTTNKSKYRNGGTMSTGATSKSGLRYSFGSNGAHNNMPPYLTVYMWKRIS